MDAAAREENFSLAQPGLLQTRTCAEGSRAELELESFAGTTTTDTMGVWRWPLGSSRTLPFRPFHECVGKMRTGRFRRTISTSNLIISRAGQSSPQCTCRTISRPHPLCKQFPNSLFSTRSHLSRPGTSFCRWNATLRRRPYRPFARTRGGMTRPRLVRSLPIHRLLCRTLVHRSSCRPGCVQPCQVQCLPIS